ncbi:hypothetical protein [Pseudomonas sp. PLB05]|uniref:hypothetical protein n=1 Tax=Pseudomonas sp. PLB05 TaxID=2899078 RepID=UPI001E4B8F1C|nr:hypothetical protein [Pseudomonas sp. PLB05]MCD4866965.1 hypothetical protein [Pseudomonas sp. PLB05]
MSANHFSAATRRMCGHTDNASFHYHSSKARQDEERYARYSLCSDCSRLLRSAWTSASAGKDVADSGLPDLWGGSAKQQAWADRIRRSRQQLVSAFRVRAAATQEPLLELASLTLDLMFRIQDPGFWIASEKAGFHVDSLKVDMELLLKGRLSPLDRTMAGSVIGYWLQADWSAVSSIARDVSDRIKPRIAGDQSGETPAFMQTA